MTKPVRQFKRTITKFPIAKIERAFFACLIVGKDIILFMELGLKAV